MFTDKLTDYVNDKTIQVSTINISMYMLTKLINEVYYHMGDMLNIDEVRRPTINMKNE